MLAVSELVDRAHNRPRKEQLRSGSMFTTTKKKARQRYLAVVSLSALALRCQMLCLSGSGPSDIKSLPTELSGTQFAASIDIDLTRL
jgi:hypothetical protein